MQHLNSFHLTEKLVVDGRKQLVTLACVNHDADKRGRVPTTYSLTAQRGQQPDKRKRNCGSPKGLLSVMHQRLLPPLGPILSLSTRAFMSCDDPLNNLLTAQAYFSKRTLVV